MDRTRDAGCGWAWQRVFLCESLTCGGDQRVASVDSTPVFLSNFSGSLTYPWPVGCRDLPGTLELLRQDACERGIPLRLFGLLPEERDRLEALCPGRFRFHSVRDSADYVYETEQLAQLHGKSCRPSVTTATALRRPTRIIASCR